MNHNVLDNFMTYHHLCVEITSFEIMKKKHLFICLGYWDESQLKKKPIYIWKEARNENKYDVPKINIGTPLMRFAEAVGEFISNSHSFSNAVNTNASAAVFDSSSSNISDSEDSLKMDQDKEEVDIDIPAKDNFLLLNHFKIPIANDSVRDKLMQEIVKFNGGRVIKYKQVCNKQGALTWVPTAKTLKQYAVHMMKKDSFYMRFRRLLVILQT
jgi:hypothetical protein